MILDTSKNVNVFAKKEVGTQSANLDLYKSIDNIMFKNEIMAKLTSSKKDGSGNITGFFQIYDENSKPLAKYLKEQVGKPPTGPGDKSVQVTLNAEPSGQNILNGSGTVFKMYDTGAAVSATPAKTPAQQAVKKP